jgi:predicted Rossmann fold nucleotide-binding protein DprA/Smf involved in DNA uptake
VGRPSKENEKPIDSNDLTQAEQTILDSLGGRARHADDLCQRTGIPAFEVQRSILKLLVHGLVEEKPGGRVQRCRGGGKPY